MESRAKTFSRGARSRSLIALVLFAVLLIGWHASPAYAQVPDVPELPLPDPPDLPIPDPGDLPLPDLDDLPVPEDLPIPDPGDLPIPDPDDLPIPDPDDLPIPDPDDLPIPDPDPDGDPVDRPGDGKDRPERAGGLKKSGEADAAPAVTPDTLAALAAAGGGSSIDQSNPTNSASDGDQGGLVESLAPFALPLISVLAIAAFLALQGYFDRKDPKLALGPIDPTDQLLTFD